MRTHPRSQQGTWLVCLWAALAATATWGQNLVDYRLANGQLEFNSISGHVIDGLGEGIPNYPVHLCKESTSFYHEYYGEDWNGEEIPGIGGRNNPAWQEMAEWDVTEHGFLTYVRLSMVLLEVNWQQCALDLEAPDGTRVNLSWGDTPHDIDTQRGNNGYNDDGNPWMLWDKNCKVYRSDIGWSAGTREDLTQLYGKDVFGTWKLYGRGYAYSSMRTYFSDLFLLLHYNPMVRTVATDQDGYYAFETDGQSDGGEPRDEQPYLVRADKTDLEFEPAQYSLIYRGNHKELEDLWWVRYSAIYTGVDFVTDGVYVEEEPEDVTPPALTAPADVSAEQTSAAGTPVDLGTPTVNDDTDPNPTVSYDAPSVFPLGTTTVTWTAMDDRGNTATATQTVTVVDTTPPTVTPPADVSYEQTHLAGYPIPNSANSLRARLGEGSATDICDADVSVSRSGMPELTGLLYYFPLGTTELTYTAVDDSGNVGTAIQNVTVVDTHGPSIHWASGSSTTIVEQTELDGTPASEVETPSAHDMCDANPQLTGERPEIFPLGTTTVVWTATDFSGNTTTEVQKVTVVDTTPPSLTPPPDITKERTGPGGTFVLLGQAARSDICDALVVVNQNAPAAFWLGTTIVTWWAIDDSGNYTEAEQKITIVDTTPPSLTAPADVTTEQSAADGTPVELGEPEVHDTGEVTLTNDAPEVFPLGDTVVTWTATDDAGNTSTATQTVTVVDTTSPDLTAPADVTAEQSSADGTAAELGLPEVSDICDADPAVTNNAPAVFPLGTTTVTWTATDDSGNVTTGTQSVTVVDTTAPSLAAPADVEAEQANADGTAVDLGPATATDICDANPVITNDAPEVFPLGTTLVTWAATDASGNVATATQTVTVTDTTAPSLTAPADVTVEQEDADGTVTDLGQPEVSDLCDADVDVVNDAQAVFPLGTTTVTWTATDDSGNVTTAKQTVTVVDTTAPEVSSVTADPNSLWPVNHKLVDVTLTVEATDICDAAPTSRIVDVTTDEDSGGAGDWTITGALTLQLRAERDGSGDGRTYAIHVETTDASGNSTLSTVTVHVPKSQGNGGKKGK